MKKVKIARKTISTRVMVFFMLAVLGLGVVVAVWVYARGADDSSTISTQTPAPENKTLLTQATGLNPQDVITKIKEIKTVEVADELYYREDATRHDRYVLDLGYSPTRGTSTACWFGTVTVSSAPLPNRTPDAVVTLSDGTQGYFVDFHCGASCGGAELTWQKGNFYYRLEKKVGSKEALIAIAKIFL